VISSCAGKASVQSPGVRICACPGKSAAPLSGGRKDWQTPGVGVAGGGASVGVGFRPGVEVGSSGTVVGVSAAAVRELPRLASTHALGPGGSSFKG
jgi:hypothetical protein